MAALRMPSALTTFGLLIFTPLKMGTSAFVLGTGVFAIGVVGFVVALLNFRDTPPDRPAESGLYSVSRNPQSASLHLATFGMCLAIGSWAALLAAAITAVFAHFRLLAEEGTCLRQYGESYRAYMERVPRYFLFF
jgi:protein-S-isoprenylcysteine O-methyltransferase Ste14